MGKVSALVSAYYAAGWLDQRLTNLYGMKGVDLEIVLVCEAGSEENIIANKYDLKVVTTNGVPTIGHAWNLASLQATGDYLTTANTDDRYYIGGLQAMVEVLDKNEDIGLVFSQVDMDNGRRAFPWKRIENRTGEVKDIKAILEKRCVIGPMPLWRKSIHDQIGMFDDQYIVASDYDMWLRMVNAGVKFYYIEDSCGVYMKRADSLENRNRELCGAENILIRKALVK